MRTPTCPAKPCSSTTLPSVSTAPLYGTRDTNAQQLVSRNSKGCTSTASKLRTPKKWKRTRLRWPWTNWLCWNWQRGRVRPRVRVNQHLLAKRSVRKSKFQRTPWATINKWQSRLQEPCPPLFDQDSLQSTTTVFWVHFHLHCYHCCCSRRCMQCCLTGQDRRSRWAAQQKAHRRQTRKQGAWENRAMGGRKEAPYCNALLRRVWLWASYVSRMLLSPKSGKRNTFVHGDFRRN